MSRYLPWAAWLAALGALGCIEPSEIEDAEQLIAAAALRDGSVADPLPGGEAGATASSGAGGAAGSGGSGGSAGGASGGSGGSGGTPASDCGDVVADFFTPTCANQFCHGETGTSPLKLLASDTASSLIDTAASMDCDGELYIDPEAPEQSLLYTKLGADPPCGTRMPLGGMQVSDEQRACVLEWITDAVAAGQ